MQPLDTQTDAHSTTVKFQDYMGATAMSIDTPSYAKALGLGQTGLLGFRFRSNAGGMGQDLAQSMSIDEHMTMQPWEMYQPGATFAGKRRFLLSLMLQNLSMMESTSRCHSSCALSTGRLRGILSAVCFMPITHSYTKHLAS